VETLEKLQHKSQTETVWALFAKLTSVSKHEPVLLNSDVLKLVAENTVWKATSKQLLWMLFYAVNWAVFTDATGYVKTLNSRKMRKAEFVSVCCWFNFTSMLKLIFSWIKQTKSTLALDFQTQHLVTWSQHFRRLGWSSRPCPQPSTCSLLWPSNKLVLVLHYFFRIQALTSDCALESALEQLWWLSYGSNTQVTQRTLYVYVRFQLLSIWIRTSELRPWLHPVQYSMMTLWCHTCTWHEKDGKCKQTTTLKPLKLTSYGTPMRHMNSNKLKLPVTRNTTKSQRLWCGRYTPKDQFNRAPST